MRNLLSISVLIALVGCGGGSTPGTSELSATVVSLGDRQGYGLVGDDGTTYEPGNLPPRFQVDGMRIRCDVRFPDGGGGEWGRPIEILDIHEIVAPAPGRELVIDGTVVRVDLEGGFFGILGDDGKHYDPVNLSREFAIDGLRVVVAARILEDRAHFHMWGELILIENIDRAESDRSAPSR